MVLSMSHGSSVLNCLSHVLVCARRRSSDIIWHENNWEDTESRFLALTIKGKGGPDIYAAFNAHSFQVRPGWDGGMGPARRLGLCNDGLGLRRWAAGGGDWEGARGGEGLAGGTWWRARLGGLG